MSKTRIVAASLAILMLASLTASTGSCEVNDLGIEVGDYWVYSMDVDENGLTFAGTVEMKVDRMATLEGKEVFYLEMSGYGDVSGSMDELSLSGSFDLDGDQVRLQSDFDVLSEDIVIDVSVDIPGISMEMSMGFETDYSPSRDDFIGDGDLELNSVQTSEFSATAAYWMSGFGLDKSGSETMSGESTLTVVAENVPVEVPAGTFDCCKIKVETTLNDSTETEYWYYSDEVGFYVKQDFSAMGMGEMELEEYGTDDGGGIVSMFTGDNLWLTLLIVVVVVVIIAVAIAMRSRRGKAPMPMTPPQPDTQIPPPPGPGQPQVPPPGEPMQPPQNPPTG